MAHENATPKHWSAEPNGNYARDPLAGWIVRYDPKPIPTKNADGTTTLSLNFPALAVTAWVGDPEQAANDVADALNENDTLRAENERLEKEVRRLRRIATDNAYMRDAYHAMLMPTGLKVAAMWKEQGVQRQRTSWSDNAWLLNGEERAQCILDWDAAPRREVLPGEIDGNLSEAAS